MLMQPAAEALDISVIIPFHNESMNIRPLYESLKAVLDTLDKRYEMIFVDDGSRDDTLVQAKAIAASDLSVKVVELARNFGQTAAMMAGIDFATGKVLVAMDGDGQNDPADIPLLLSKIDEGYDVVSGWRKDRKDAALTRTLPSRIANRLISTISGVHLHDYGCSLKAYRHDVIKNVRLYGEMHRFIPIYTSWQGGRIAEIPVRHHPRRHGISKYGLNRIFKVVLDLAVVRFLDRYLTKPIYVFGMFGLISLSGGAAAFIWMLWLKLVSGISLILTPLPLLSAILFSTGVLSILMGLLAEMMVRTYFEAQDKRVYLVRSLVNLG